MLSCENGSISVSSKEYGNSLGLNALNGVGAD